MKDLGTVHPGRTLYIEFDSFGASGESITLTGLATTDIEVYKDGSTTQRASDSGYALLDTDGIDFDGITGIHGLSIDLSDNTTAGFWAAGSHYRVVVSAVTINSQAVSFTAATFRIGYENAILNTTIATLSSQTSFTLTAGPAEDDALNRTWAVIHDVASAVQKAVVEIIDYTGSTKTVTLAAGATFTVAASDNISIMGPMPLQPTTTGTRLDVTSGGCAGVDWANVEAPTTTVGLSGTTIATTQKVDVETIKTNAVVNGGTVTFPTNATLASTTNITAAAGCAVSSIGNDVITAASIAANAIDADALAADAVAEINATVDTALADYDGPTYTELLNLVRLALRKDAALATDLSSLITTVNADLGSGGGSFASTTDSQEAIRDRGDAAWITATSVAVGSGGITSSSFASGAITAAAIAADAIGASELAADAVAEIADAVWDEAISGHLSAGTTGASLNAAGSAGDPWTTTLPGSYTGSQAGNILGTYLDATVSSRLASASISLSGGAVTVGTNNDKTGYRLSATGVDDIWDEPLAAHTTADTPGNVLNMLTQDTVTLSSDVALGSIVGQLLDGGTSWTYDRTTDSLEAIRDRGDSAWITATSVTVSDKTGFSLATTGMDAVTLPANLITATSIAANAITAAKIADAAIDAATFAADVDAEILSYLVDDATRIDASALNTATATTIPAILADTAEIGTAGAGLTNITLPSGGLANVTAWTVAITGNVTGNLSGSVGSVTGNVGGNVTGSVGSLATQAKADVNAEVVDVIRTDTNAEPSTAPAATATLQKKIDYIYQALRNKLTITSGSKTIYDDAGSALWSKALSDDGTTYTEAEGA